MFSFITSVVSPNHSKFQEMIDTGKMKSLVTATVEEFDNIMKLMTYKPMNIHKQVSKTKIMHQYVFMKCLVMC